MFDFLAMAGNYKDRVVGRWQDGARLLSTAAVNDGAHPFETAICHPEYNEGEAIIVEAYDTREAALVGHEKWLVAMRDGPLPDVLVDCENSELSQIVAARGQMAFKRARPT